MSHQVEGPLGVGAQASLIFSPGGTGTSPCPQPGPSLVVLKISMIPLSSALFRGILPTVPSPQGAPVRWPRLSLMQFMGNQKPALK